MMWYSELCRVVLCVVCCMLGIVILSRIVPLYCVLCWCVSYHVMLSCVVLCCVVLRLGTCCVIELCYVASRLCFVL